MIPLRLQIILIITSSVVFGVILHNIRKQRLTTNLGIPWILWALFLIVISVFPIIGEWLCAVTGIESAIHVIYLIMIFLLYVLLFVLFLRVSILEEKQKNIIQYLALEKKKDEENIHKD